MDTTTGSVLPGGYIDFPNGLGDFTQSFTVGPGVITASTGFSPDQTSLVIDFSPSPLEGLSGGTVTGGFVGDSDREFYFQILPGGTIVDPAPVPEPREFWVIAALAAIAGIRLRNRVT
jgi:hypothetical protein